MGGQGHFHGEFHDAAVEHRKDAGHSEAHGAGVSVGSGTEGRGTPAENLAPGEELSMNLQADDGFVFHKFDSLLSMMMLFEWMFTTS